ncbi:MAG: hypothetical protein AB7T49_17755 [Oligoflexales bacterium]
MKYCSTLVAAMLALSACKSTPGKQRLMDSDSSSTGIFQGTSEWTLPFVESEKVNCPSGQELFTAGLNRIENIAPSALGLQGEFILEKPGIRLDNAIEGANYITPNYAVRFDFCFDGGETLVLHRIVIQKKSEYSFGGLQPQFHVLKVSSPQPLPAFSQALFEQDYSAIAGKFLSNSEAVPSYYIKGHKLDSGQSFLTISTFTQNSDPAVVVGPEGDGKPTVSIGELEPGGNPYEAYETPIGEDDGLELATHALTKNHLKFNFVYEVRIRAGGYRTYRYDRRGLLEITDTNPNLASTVSIKIEKSAVKDAMNYSSSHHNLSDEFVFKDPAGQAEYKLLPFSDDTGRIEITYREDLGIEPITLEIKRVLSPINSQ